MITGGIETIHLASQYLAAAAISFLAKRDDDSHTNLGFSKEEKRFLTWPLNNSDVLLALNLEQFSLEWIKDSETTSFMLDGESHNSVMDWLDQSSKNLGFQNPYRYDFHYSLPYTITSDFIFQVDQKSLEREMRLRSLAQAVLSQILEMHGLISDIRTWPHHFDTGIFSALPSKPTVALGIGLAIPDSLISDYYFYVSGYQGHKSLDTSAFSTLEKGLWRQKGFQGAVLPAGDLDVKIVLKFLNEAIDAYSE